MYEDRIVLVRAKSHGEAKSKARGIVTKGEVPYKNPLGNLVHWKVWKVYESVELFDDEFKGGKPKDGAQVYWRYLRAADPVKKLKTDGTMNALF
jgi:starvation-inducible outer membrane lipoprotein